MRDVLAHGPSRAHLSCALVSRCRWPPPRRRLAGDPAPAPRSRSTATPTHSRRFTDDGQRTTPAIRGIGRAGGRRRLPRARPELRDRQPDHRRHRERGPPEREPGAEGHLRVPDRRRQPARHLRPGDPDGGPMGGRARRRRVGQHEVPSVRPRHQRRRAAASTSRRSPLSGSGSSAYTAVPSQTFSLIRTELLPQVAGQSGSRNFLVYADGINVPGVGGEAQIRNDDSVAGTAHGIGGALGAPLRPGRHRLLRVADQLRRPAPPAEPTSTSPFTRSRTPSARSSRSHRTAPPRSTAATSTTSSATTTTGPGGLVDVRRLQHPVEPVLGLQQGRLLQSGARGRELSRHPLERLQLRVHVPGEPVRPGRRPGAADVRGGDAGRRIPSRHDLRAPAPQQDPESHRHLPVQLDRAGLVITSAATTRRLSSLLVSVHPPEAPPRDGTRSASTRSTRPATRTRPRPRRRSRSCRVGAERFARLPRLIEWLDRRKEVVLS